MNRVRRTSLVLEISLAVWLAGSGFSPATVSASNDKHTLQVFAAASLTGAFNDLGHAFEHQHPGVRVLFNFAGTQQLAAQLEQGAVADVFASADERWMNYVRGRSLIAGAPSTFALNRLVVIVPRSNPARIARLQDLAKSGVKLVIGAPAVPVGQYARTMIYNLSRDTTFEATFAIRTLRNVVSEEENVKSVVGKVQLGEADAGVVYRSDITPTVARYVRVFEIPETANVPASYPIALLTSSRMPTEARAFVDLVLSDTGQQTLARWGLIPVAPTKP